MLYKTDRNGNQNVFGLERNDGKLKLNGNRANLTFPVFGIIKYLMTMEMNEQQRQEALNNLLRWHARLPDGSLVPLTDREKEKLDIQTYFIKHHGHGVVFNSNGWTFPDDDPSDWDLTV